MCPKPRIVIPRISGDQRLPRRSHANRGAPIIAEETALVQRGGGTDTGHTRGRGGLLTGGLPAAASCLAASTQTLPTDLRGIYIYTNDVSRITTATASQLDASFKIPGVDGVAVVIGWDAVEPLLGQYGGLSTQAGTLVTIQH